MAQIETDLSPVRTALWTLSGLIDSLPTRLEFRVIVRKRLFGGENALEKYISVRTEIDPVYGACRQRIIYEPSFRLLMTIWALRAVNCQPSRPSPSPSIP